MKKKKIEISGLNTQLVSRGLKQWYHIRKHIKKSTDAIVWVTEPVSPWSLGAIGRRVNMPAKVRLSVKEK